MPTFYEMLILETENEHVFEHVYEHQLSVKKNFSTPKVYTANGDLKKRWYVYFSYRNPKSGKLERMKNIYGNVNTFTIKEDRLAVLSSYRKNLLRLLRDGYSPFEEVEILQQPEIKEVIEVKEISATIVATPVATVEVKDEEPTMTVREAFEYGLKLKEKLIRSTTKRGYVNKVANFVGWVEKKYPEIKSVNDLTKKIAAEFLNEILDRTSARNRNNYRLEMGSIMQTLEDNDIVAVNFFRKFPVLKSTPERNKTYTKQTQEDIFEYLETQDPILLLFIKFISYNFLRPIEVCRLKVGDVNLTNRTLQFKAKSSPLKTKIIPELLINDLPDLSSLNKEDALFTPDCIGGVWDVTDDNRRDHFSKRYKSVVKEHFNLGKDYGLYSFRHTYITKLYREIRKTASPFEAKSMLMLITGHSSMVSLEKYLRDIDAELPEDYSAMLQ
jgi:integrase